MKTKFNQWYPFLFFIPLVLGFIVSSIPQHHLHSSQTQFAISNFLFVLSVCLVFSYQAYLVIAFNKADDKGSTIFKTNTLVPVIFTWLYLCYVSYFTFIKDSFHNPKFVPGPLRTANMGPVPWVILIMLLYGLINFLFVNNQYVLSRIKKQKDVNRQAYLQLNYWLPIQKFVRASIWIFAGSMILSVIADLFTLFSK